MVHCPTTAQALSKAILQQLFHNNYYVATENAELLVTLKSYSVWLRKIKNKKLMPSAGHQ